MQSINLNKLSISEKILMLEELWDDLSKNAEDAGFTPSWHIEILDSREQKIANNDAKFDDFSNAKERLIKFAN